MTARVRCFYLGILITSCLTDTARAQQSFTWQQIKDKFEAANPTLKAVQLNIDESRAAEITAYLRPNPDFSLTADGLQISRNQGVWRPFNGVLETPGIGYLHERQHKRELRREAARQSTDVAESTYSDQKRGLLFNLRGAFVQLLQAKAVLENAKQNLEYWDRELAINRRRYDAGQHLRQRRAEHHVECRDDRSDRRQSGASEHAAVPHAELLHRLAGNLSVAELSIGRQTTDDRGAMRREHRPFVIFRPSA